MDAIAVLIDVIDLSIEPSIAAVAATQMLPMRRRGLFLAIELIGAFLWAFVFGEILVWFWAGTIVLLALEFVVPYLMWEGTALQKISALFLVQMCMLVAGGVASACWASLFGASLPEDSAMELAYFRNNMGRWAIYEALDVGVAALLLVPAASLFRQWSRRMRNTRGINAFVGLLIGQLMMAGVLAICLARSLGSAAFAVVALVTAVCLVVGAGAMGASWHWEVAARAQRRSEELRRQRKAYLEEYERAWGEVETVAHWRHDFRNELAAAQELQQRGDADDARRLLVALEERIALGDPQREVRP